MQNPSLRTIDRRGFLCLGSLAGVFLAVGCDGSGNGDPVPVTTPPLKGGNREKLQKLEEKGAATNAKKKK
jgi:hypothetical protein